MQIKYDKATIYIYGHANKEKIEEATINFMRKVRSKNGNKHTSRTIKEK